MFSFGLVQFAIAILMPAAYLGVLMLRYVSAWVGRTKGPQERALVIVVMLAVVGFIAGGILQAQWDRTAECRASGQPLGVCLVGFKIAAPNSTH